MRHTRRMIALVSVLLVSACGSDSLLGPDALQGIDGAVTIGPQCPVQSLENPCPDLPYRAWIDVREASGERVTRVRSDAEGLFRLGLKPGLYTLLPESGDPFPRAGESRVMVVRGRYTAVTIGFDTGIR